MTKSWATVSLSIRVRTTVSPWFTTIVAGSNLSCAASRERYQVIVICLIVFVWFMSGSPAVLMAAVDFVVEVGKPAICDCSEDTASELDLKEERGP